MIMTQMIQDRLAALREVMRRESIDAFIFPSTDPHNGEYVPAHWEGRKWISGFDGSAGSGDNGQGCAMDRLQIFHSG